MFLRFIYVLFILISFSFGSSIYAADLLGAKKYDATGISNHVSAKVLRSNQLSLSSSYYYLSEPNINLIDGTYHNLKMDSASIFSTNIGYGIADIIEFDLGVHFSHEQMDQDVRKIIAERSDEKTQTSLASNYPKNFDFSGVSALMKVSLLDLSMYRLALSGLIESAAKESASYTLTRSSKLSGGWILSNEIDLGKYFEFDLNIGDIYSHSQQVGDYKIADRMFIQSIAKIKTSDFLIFFLGSEYKHIKLNSAYTVTANAYTGIELQGKNFGLQTFVGRYISESCLGYAPFSVGLSLTYRTTPVNYTSLDSNDLDQDQDENKDQATNKVSKDKKPRLVASSSKEDLRFTQKDGVFYDEDGQIIDVQGSLKKEFQDDRDEFYDFDRKIQASRQGEQVDPAVISEQYYQEELAKARAQKELEYKKEVRKQQLAEIERKKALKKRVEEEDRLERKYQNSQFDELNDLPEITDDEINWNGLE